MRLSCKVLNVASKNLHMNSQYFKVQQCSSIDSLESAKRKLIEGSPWRGSTDLLVCSASFIEEKTKIQRRWCSLPKVTQLVTVPGLAVKPALSCPDFISLFPRLTSHHEQFIDHLQNIYSYNFLNKIEQSNSRFS